MPLRTKAHRAGLFEPSDLELLGKVFARTAVAGETDHAREARASRIIAYFQMGIDDEDELCMLVKLPLGR